METFARSQKSALQTAREQREARAPRRRPHRHSNRRRGVSYLSGRGLAPPAAQETCRGQPTRRRRPISAPAETSIKTQQRAGASRRMSAGPAGKGGAAANNSPAAPQVPAPGSQVASLASVYLRTMASGPPSPPARTSPGTAEEVPMDSTSLAATKVGKTNKNTAVPKILTPSTEVTLKEKLSRKTT